MNQADRSAQFTEYVVARQLWLRRLAYLLCRDWHRSDDLVQSSLAKLYANWHRIDQSASPDGYARTVLVNTFISEERGRRWKRIVLVRDVEEGENAPEQDVDGVLDLRRALIHLPARQRATLVLRYYSELSVDETAQALGCSAGTVKSQTSHALTTLRRLLHIDETDEAIANAATGISHIAPAYNEKG